MSDVLRVIGRKLVSLVVRDMIVKDIDVIVECCPNLQYLEVASKREIVNDRWLYVGQDAIEETKMKLKNGLKSLAKLKLNKESVCLGTDWKG
jgi:hypothetical protein